MSSSQKIEPWWKLCVPKKDIMLENIKEKEFTADLGSFLSGEAPDIYKDPIKFYDNTFITQEMKSHFNNILSAIEGKKAGPSIIQIDTPYGGGKTHTLIALYHLLNSNQLLKTHEKLLDIYNNHKVPKSVKVACFDGVAVGVDGTLHVDTGIKTRTFLGEIFYQLGIYGLISEKDQLGQSIGSKKLGDCLKQVGPCLILIDEFLVYVAKIYPHIHNPELKPIIDTLLPSIQELYSAIASSDSAALVITYPSRIEQIFNEYALNYKDKLYAWLESFKNVASRTQTTKMVAVGTTEIGSILQTRLFQTIPSLEIRNLIGNAFNIFYNDNQIRDSLPSRIQESAYKEDIANTYPFHPELLRIFHEQWGTLPRFQLTRHLLKILVEVLREEYNKRVSDRRDSPLIMPGHINLMNPNIQSIIFDAVDRNFDKVLESDISRASTIDQKFNPDTPLGKGKYTVALTTAIFLHSHSGSTAASSPRKHIASAGATIGTCLLSVLAPLYFPPITDPKEGLPPITDITSITQKLLDSEIGLYYLHCTIDLQYYFDLKKNLTLIAAQQYNNFAGNLDSLVSELQKKWMAKGIPLTPILFPTNPEDIPDQKDDLFIVLLDPRNVSFGESSNFQYINNFVENKVSSKAGVSTGDKRRRYKNRIFFLIADEKLWRQVEIAYRWAESWETTTKLNVFKDATIPEQEHAVRQVNKYKEDFQNYLLTLFHYLFAEFEKNTLKTEPIDILQYLLLKNVSPLQRIYDFLIGRIDEHKYYIWDTLRPDLLVNNERYRSAWGENQTEISAQEIWDNFAKNTTLPRLENVNVLRLCIQQGLNKSFFGVAYKNDGEATYTEILSDESEIRANKPLSEIILYRLNTELKVKCNDCEKIFTVSHPGAKFLCTDCIKVTCARCGKVVKAKDILSESEGCIKCQGKIKCENCSKFVNESELRLEGKKCVNCLDKKECPGCKEWVTEDQLLPTDSENPIYCKICEKWIACSKCKRRYPKEKLIEGLCEKCHIIVPPPPKKLKCKKCRREFLPFELKEGFCSECQKQKETYISQIDIEIPISNLNEEASVFSDIQQAFAAKKLDEVTSGKITLIINIRSTNIVWKTKDEAKEWIITNFETPNRRVKAEYKQSFQDSK